MLLGFCEIVIKYGPNSYPITDSELETYSQNKLEKYMPYFTWLKRIM